MAMVKRSITLTQPQFAWIRAQIAAGRFATESEVIRSLIRERREGAETTAGSRDAPDDAGPDLDDEIDQTLRAILRKAGLRSPSNMIDN